MVLRQRETPLLWVFSQYTNLITSIIIGFFGCCTQIMNLSLFWLLIALALSFESQRLYKNHQKIIVFLKIWKWYTDTKKQKNEILCKCSVIACLLYSYHPCQSKSVATMGSQNARFITAKQLFNLTRHVTKHTFYVYYFYEITYVLLLRNPGM